MRTVPGEGVLLRRAGLRHVDERREVARTRERRPDVGLAVGTVVGREGAPLVDHEGGRTRRRTHEQECAQPAQEPRCLATHRYWLDCPRGVARGQARRRVVRRSGGRLVLGRWCTTPPEGPRCRPANAPPPPNVRRRSPRACRARPSHAIHRSRRSARPRRAPSSGCVASAWRCPGPPRRSPGPSPHGAPGRSSRSSTATTTARRTSPCGSRRRPACKRRWSRRIRRTSSARPTSATRGGSASASIASPTGTPSPASSPTRPRGRDARAHRTPRRRARQGAAGLARGLDRRRGRARLSRAPDPNIPS